MRRTTGFVLSCASLATAIAAAAACNAGDTAPSASGPPPELAPLDASTSAVPTIATSPPSVYVAKVKGILVGLPPTDDEVKAVAADPSKLAGLIDGWMALPAYQDKMLRFFQLAFQQTQIDGEDFIDQTGSRRLSRNAVTTPLLLQNATESFARTVLALVAAGRPLTEAMTTRSFMMTPPLMELYAFLDAWQIDDAGTISDRFAADHAGVAITITSDDVPLSASVDPKSPNFMRWHDPDVTSVLAKDPVTCGADPLVYPRAEGGYVLHSLLHGSIENRKGCKGTSGTAAAPQFSVEDYANWKMVTTRGPRAGEHPTDFYDLPRLRQASEIVLAVPRVGFFSTPAFFANWRTNDSNQMRVTMNQALIVALGAAVDGSDTTVPSSTPGLDGEHAGNPACASCHRTLDPTRSIFAASYSWYFHNQTDPAFSSQPGLFAFRGVTKPVATLDEFGGALATHPLFAEAWVQKLCFYANSRACKTDDPEFTRIVGVFQSSGYSWSALVRELMASPLTTNARPSAIPTESSELVAVARRDHLCASLNHRLQLVDVCDLDAVRVAKKSPVASVAPIVAGLPSDGYGRGSVAPILPNAPTLFYRAGTENICASVASLVIDGPADPQNPDAKRWSSTTADAAISEFVSLLMGLVPSDPRSAPSQAVLAAHHASALASGASATDALRSTFVLACVSPSALSIGL